MMKCTHTIELLPLYATGDLPPAKAETMREHLRSCGQCRALAEEFAAEFAAGRDWLRDQVAPDFSEDDFEELRAGVWRRIDAEAARVPFWERFFPRLNRGIVLAVASAALLIAFGLAIYLRAARTIPTPKSEIVEAPPAPSPVERRVAEHIVLQERRGEMKQQLARRKKRQSSRRRLLIPDAPARQPEIARSDEAAPNAGPEMMRIEIQTADPKIKIIWFAPKEESPQSDSMLATSE